MAFECGDHVVFVGDAQDLEQIDLYSTDLLSPSEYGTVESIEVIAPDHGYFYQTSNDRLLYEVLFSQSGDRCWIPDLMLDRHGPSGKLKNIGGF